MYCVLCKSIVTDCIIWPEAINTITFNNNSLTNGTYFHWTAVQWTAVLFASQKPRMSAMVPDSAIELTGFSVHRSDRMEELTGKSRGGGVCFYINNLWCDERNIHSIKSFCSPDLEFHTLLCRPFWLPREFTAIIITAVYIPPPSQQAPGTQGTVQEYKRAGNHAPRCSFYYHGGL